MRRPCWLARTRAARSLRLARTCIGRLSSSYAIAPDGDTIARAQLDGSAPNLLWGAGLGDPCGLASYSHYLYFGAAGGVIDQIDTDSPSL